VIQLLSTIYAYAYPEDSTDTPQPQFKILKNASYILGTPWDTRGMRWKLALFYSRVLSRGCLMESWGEVKNITQHRYPPLYTLEI